MEHKQIIAKDVDTGLRLDKYLTEQLVPFSRSRIQMLFAKGAITVNGKLGKANYKVKNDDVIEVMIEEEQEANAQPEAMDLNIVYEDEDVIVINKPKGMVVHPSPGNEAHTLVNGLLYHCKDLSGINGVLRPGIVHRIDKDTSGLLVAAKNDRAHQLLAEQLKDKTMNRRYYALVHGVMPHDHGTIDAPIGRDEKDRQKMAVTAHNSKPAITHFQVIERFAQHTLLECRLETGRTHQIRVHLQYIKFPIVGDPKYGRRKTEVSGGQLLHAHQLTFVHPTSQASMTFDAPLPPQFASVLDELRKREG